MPQSDGLPPNCGEFLRLEKKFYWVDFPQLAARVIHYRRNDAWSSAIRRAKKNPTAGRCGLKILSVVIWRDRTDSEGFSLPVRRGKNWYWRGCRRLDTLIFPVFYLPLGFFFADSVLFLDLADELVAFAFDLIQFVIGELTPFFLNLAFDLFPISLCLIPIHIHSPFLVVAGLHELQPTYQFSLCRLGNDSRLWLSQQCQEQGGALSSKRDKQARMGEIGRK
jgi:hypothetical protein